ncbi:MAG: tRNA (adenosine(37)-N6)-dimethylallyltransferase MiaA [Candidatus Kerfeldbacteria bacterium]|nr:tRNA (adenosine(37)-N6)-dimethylallyltransferase MiaA [Candidatus Kerfeldbacteria bacterium]
MKQPLIVIVGPTASGKTSLSLALAKKFHGEIVSADSRQVYRGMDIGSGKATKKEQTIVPHHLLDVATPTQEYTVAHFKRDAQKAIYDIHRRGHLPFLVGGTGFWIRTVIDDLALPSVKPNKKLRARLMKKSPAQLYTLLKGLDPRRAKTIDRQNPYRLIRAIEIIKATDAAVPPLTKSNPYRILMIGINPPQKKLHRNIAIRLRSRLQRGMIAEVQRLHRRGVSWKRLEALGLEYRYISRYLQRKLSRQDMVRQLEHEIQQYAKRQRTWFRPDTHIHWNLTRLEIARLIASHIHQKK